MNTIHNSALGDLRKHELVQLIVDLRAENDKLRKVEAAIAPESQSAPDRTFRFDHWCNECDILDVNMTATHHNGDIIRTCSVCGQTYVD